MSDVSVAVAERPSPPAANSDEEDRWAMEATIAFDGGYIVSAYGNLVQTWNLPALLDSCASVTVNRAGYTATRTLTIGGSSQQVTVPAGT